METVEKTKAMAWAEHSGTSSNRMDFTSTAHFIATLSRSTVPFFIYEDEAITMNGFHEICEYGQREDAVLAKLLRHSRWRTYDPDEARLFFVLIPFHQSYFCGSNASRIRHVEKTFSYWRPDGEKVDWRAFDRKWHNKWENRTHLERVERAVAAVKLHMKTYPTVPHVMPAFSWQSSAWNYVNYRQVHPRFFWGLFCSAWVHVIDACALLFFLFFSLDHIVYVFVLFLFLLSDGQCQRSK